MAEIEGNDGQERKMPLDGAGNPEAKNCGVASTAPYFTLAFFLVKRPFLVVRSRSDERKQWIGAPESYLVVSFWKLSDWRVGSILLRDQIRDGVGQGRSKKAV
jgi:hypothetical protein